jgi:hypothetical protein
MRETPIGIGCGRIGRVARRPRARTHPEVFQHAFGMRQTPALCQPSGRAGTGAAATRVAQAPAEAAHRGRHPFWHSTAPAARGRSARREPSARPLLLGRVRQAAPFHSLIAYSRKSSHANHIRELL